MAEITNRESLEVWLEDKPQAVSVAIAARAALRVFPMLWTAQEEISEERFIAITLTRFRANAVASATGLWPAQQQGLREAAAYAVYAADAATAAARAATAYTADTAYTAAAAATAAAATAADATAADAARASATAADAAADAATAADAAAAAGWKAVQADVNRIAEASMNVNESWDAAAAALMRTPVWPEQMPEEIKQNWASFERYLYGREELWGVWIDWYKDALLGKPGPEALEIEKCLIPNEDWKHEDNPLHINRIIQGLIQKHSPTPPAEPEPRPSPVHFEFRDGALHKAPSDAPTSLGDRQATAEQARRGLCELMEDFLASDPGRNSPKLGRVLDRCRSALGARFDELEIGLLGVHAARLDAYALQAQTILMEEDASDLVALNAQLGIFIGQFPEWSDYLAGLSEGFGTPEAEAEAVDNAAQVFERIREEAPEILAEDAVIELDALREAATPEVSAEGGGDASALAKRSFLRAARDAIATYCGEALSSVRKGSLKGFEKTGEKTVIVALAAGGGALVALAVGLPAEFGWLSGMVTYFRQMLGGKQPDGAGEKWWR